MAKFCISCGAQLGDTVKFCASCGTQQQSAQQTPSQPQQPRPQAQPYQPQPQYQQQYAPAPIAPKNKKSRLPLILSVIGVCLVAVIIGVVLLSTCAMNIVDKTAKADYYEIGKDKIPSVKLVLGEERTVTRVSTSIENGATRKEIEYKVSGTQQNDEMWDYFIYLCNVDGFLQLSDVIDFNGPSGIGVVGRNSVESGYEIQLQIKYDRNGYTISMIRQQGGIISYDPSSRPTTGNSSTAPNISVSASASASMPTPSSTPTSASVSTPSSTPANTSGSTGSLTKDIFGTIGDGTYHMKMRALSGDAAGTEIEIWLK
ncbi:MAG: zinc ribbon domain-containing protein, partial [Dehalococcoidia bacterium]|nr:zinc ribbon domain-containing protein [Dehalococcoidia bacterium]